MFLLQIFCPCYSPFAPNPLHLSSRNYILPWMRVRNAEQITGPNLCVGEVEILILDLLVLTLTRPRKFDRSLSSFRPKLFPISGLLLDVFMRMSCCLVCLVAKAAKTTRATSSSVNRFVPSVSLLSTCTSLGLYVFQLPSSALMQHPFRIFI